MIRMVVLAKNVGAGRQVLHHHAVDDAVVAPVVCIIQRMRSRLVSASSEGRT
jgi:hypothetical protein